MATTVRITEDLEKKYKALYGTKTTGAQEAVECFLYLRAHTLAGLKCYFTKNELSALIDIQNGTIMQSQFAISKEVLIAEIQDSNKIEGLAARWGININKLISKIGNLFAAQVYFLQSEINRFWNVPEAYGSPSPDLEKFLDEYC